MARHSWVDRGRCGMDLGNTTFSARLEQVLVDAPTYPND
jgi:hypothetical protein